jgi:hypothetical protein
MKISELIEMCRSRIINLSQLRSSAVMLGDAEQVSRIDVQIDETQTTLNKLLTLV